MINYEKNVILFGLTQIEYTPAMHYLENCNKDNVILIVDNNPALTGRYNGIPVYPQKMLYEYADNTELFIVITTFRYHTEITNALLNIGFHKDQIIVALKDEDFYASYASAFYNRKYNLDAPTPTRAYIELSRNCNCRCIYCPMFGIHPTIQSETGFMDWDTLEAITHQIGKIPSITTGDFCGYGETYFHPEWYEMMKYVMENTNIRNLSIYSNGMLLNEDVLHKLEQLNFDKLVLEISVDGESPDENDQYRKGSKYIKLKENIHYAAQYFSGKKVSFSVLNTHPVTESYLSENNYEIPAYLPVPDYLQSEFPDMYTDCSVTRVFMENDCYKANGITLHSERVKRGDMPCPCTNIFEEINFNYLGDSISCFCSMNSFDEPIANAFDNDFFERWANGVVMKTMRKAFMDGKIPKECIQCTKAPTREINIAVIGEKVF